jgi:hypothetical protein
MSSIVLPFPTALLYRALNRWSAIWNTIAAKPTNISDPAELWKVDGFMMYADEFMLLAQAHLDNALLSSKQLEGLLPSLPSTTQESIDGLSTLDETSMNQVTELMLHFEALHMY